MTARRQGVNGLLAPNLSSLKSHVCTSLHEPPWARKPWPRWLNHVGKKTVTKIWKTSVGMVRKYGDVWKVGMKKHVMIL